jgi:hypothetical protein
MRDLDIKDLYNTYLRIYRKKQNKPYKLRTNWEGIENMAFYKDLLRVKNFLDRNYVVNVEDFFVSPYEIYGEDTTYTLDYYSTLNAVKVYTLYCNKKNSLDPDSDNCIEFILKGLKFMENFCKKHKITLGQYLEFKEKGDIIPSFIMHIKEKNILFYNVLLLKNFEKEIGKIDFSTLKFILGDVASKISIFRSKLYSSKKAKNIAVQGLKIIEKNITTT